MYWEKGLWCLHIHSTIWAQISSWTFCVPHTSKLQAQYRQLPSPSKLMTSFGSPRAAWLFRFRQRFKTKVCWLSLMSACVCWNKHLLGSHLIPCDINPLTLSCCCFILALTQTVTLLPPTFANFTLLFCTTFSMILLLDYFISPFPPPSSSIYLCIILSLVFTFWFCWYLYFYVTQHL